MAIERVRSRREIERFLRRDPYLYLYHLGDLDPFFRRRTTWIARREQGRIADLVLLYEAGPVLVLLGFSREPLEGMRSLLAELAPELPGRAYAHLSGDLAAVLADSFRIRDHGPFLRMALLNPRLDEIDTEGTIPLGPGDREELDALYAAAYPGSWFDPAVLETGCYYGIRNGGRLVSVAGIHVVSRKTRVAALGNVATHPEHRGRGLAARACARLCRELLPEIRLIGLNVSAANAAAVTCYRKLGFETVARYSEYTLEKF